MRLSELEKKEVDPNWTIPEELEEEAEFLMNEMLRLTDELPDLDA